MCTSIRVDQLRLRRDVETLSNHTELALRTLDVMSSNMAEMYADMSSYKVSGRPGELGVLPSMNPLLRDFNIPFEDDEEVRRFFTRGPTETKEKVTHRQLELQRYITTQHAYSHSNFVNQMVQLVMTKKYRLAKSYRSERG